MKLCAFDKLSSQVLQPFKDRILAPLVPTSLTGNRVIKIPFRWYNHPQTSLAHTASALRHGRPLPSSIKASRAYILGALRIAKVTDLNSGSMLSPLVLPLASDQTNGNSPALMSFSFNTGAANTVAIPRVKATGRLCEPLVVALNFLNAFLQ